MSDHRVRTGVKCMIRNPEATAQTRENLMQAFWLLYSRKKIDHITVREITDTAGYNRSTFYEYFTGSYDVLNQIEDMIFAHIKGSTLDSLTEEQNEDIVRKLADLYESQGKYLSVLLGENGDPQFSKKLKSTMRPVLMKAFGWPEMDVHSDYIFEFGISAIIASITHWYQNHKDLPSQEFIALIRSMLVHGVMPEIRKSQLPG